MSLREGIMNAIFIGASRSVINQIKDTLNGSLHQINYRPAITAF